VSSAAARRRMVTRSRPSSRMRATAVSMIPSRLSDGFADVRGDCEGDDRHAVIVTNMFVTNKFAIGRRHRAASTRLGSSPCAPVGSRGPGRGECPSHARQPTPRRRTRVRPQPGSRRLAERDVEGEATLVVAHGVRPGVELDMGHGDAWPAIRERARTQCRHPRVCHADVDGPTSERLQACARAPRRRTVREGRAGKAHHLREGQPTTEGRF